MLAEEPKILTFVGKLLQGGICQCEVAVSPKYKGPNYIEIKAEDIDDFADKVNFYLHSHGFQTIDPEIDEDIPNTVNGNLYNKLVEIMDSGDENAPDEVEYNRYTDQIVIRFFFPEGIKYT